MAAPQFFFLIALTLSLAGPGWALAEAGPETGSGIKAAAQPESDQARPQAWLPEKIHNFGTVKGGQTVSHDFVIHNKGQADLIIQKVTPG